MRSWGNESPVKSRHCNNTRAFTLCGTEVCKALFLNTLAISDRVMRTATEKSKKGHTEPDKRGCNPSRCYPPEVIEAVKNHKKRFPVIESHYVREESKCQFLSPNLNLHIMFELHLADSRIIKKVGETTYRNILNTSFNLGFHKPKKDSCEVCIKFENVTPQQKEVLEQNYQIHQVNKAVAREIKANEKLLAQKNPQTTACLAFDLQKV